MPRWRRFALQAVNAVAGRLAAGALGLIRRFDRKRVANFTGPLMAWIGPWRSEHQTGRDNLKAAFPEKSPDEIEKILHGVWDNLGRFTADFAHLDRMTVYDTQAPGPSDIEYTTEALARFEALRDSGKPALLFAAHLANWELPALIAHRYGIRAAVLYRRPNIAAIAEAVVRIRAGSMGTLIPSSMSAPILLANALLDRQAVGMLVDQYYREGVEVTFFGRKTRANPLIARLARQIDCPIQGTRVIRLPGNRFRADLTDPIAVVRGADGRIDVAGTMQAVTNVVEDWVREYPEQWLWVHRRWR